MKILQKMPRTSGEDSCFFLFWFGFVFFFWARYVFGKHKTQRIKVVLSPWFSLMSLIHNTAYDIFFGQVHMTEQL